MHIIIKISNFLMLTFASEILNEKKIDKIEFFNFSFGSNFFLLNKIMALLVYLYLIPNI